MGFDGGETKHPGECFVRKGKFLLSITIVLFVLPAVNRKQRNEAETISRPLECEG
jgi:hypothetical protein